MPESGFDGFVVSGKETVLNLFGVSDEHGMDQADLC
jgi:hypothetical protein